MCRSHTVNSFSPNSKATIYWCDMGSPQSTWRWREAVESWKWWSLSIVDKNTMCFFSAFLLVFMLSYYMLSHWHCIRPVAHIEHHKKSDANGHFTSSWWCIIFNGGGDEDDDALWCRTILFCCAPGRWLVVSFSRLVVVDGRNWGTLRGSTYVAVVAAAA